jgi:DNA-binding PadR family transcriptional regulator
MRLIEFLGLPDMEEQVLKHGGRREGSGRKPHPDGIVRKLYALTPKHVEALERYRKEHSLSSSSAAIRRLIESWSP